MKKNWTQIATLCLCVVLLIVTIVQGKKDGKYTGRKPIDVDEKVLRQVNQ